MKYLWKLKMLFEITLLISTMMFSEPCWAANPESDNVPASANTSKVPLSFLFVLSAQSGKLTKTGDTYTLTLNDVAPRVLWFTDKPHRRAGFAALPDFLAHWSRKHATDPLNAAMIHASMQSSIIGQNQPIAMMFSDLVYSKSQLTFTLMKLKGNASKIKPGAFYDIKIFFDNVGWFDNRPVAQQDLSQGYLSEYLS